MVISREPGEAFYLEGYRQSFITLRCLSHAGPFALIDGSPTAADLELAARLLARYSQGRDADCVTIGIERPGRPGEVQAVAPLLPEAVPKAWHV